ncbi:MAG TPA: hypothetical protein PLA83_01845 [Deltaproteobacteria bacterium]|nr:hypothetical protein [Deltaproteobacteria bacterium]HQI02928.1 hypothetical protein [Deltaproteobacteria bacterium]
MDACAMEKYFLPENGSELMHWLCSKKAILCGVRCISSPKVRLDFFHAIEEKCRSGQISQDQADRIKTKASDLFEKLIQGNGEVPLHAPAGENVTADEMAERHKLTIGKHNWDMDRIETIVSNLSFLTKVPKLQVVTPDEGFGEILALEGYGVINPEAMKLGELLEEWAAESSH